MLEAKLENGEVCDFNSLKGYVQNFGKDYLLSDMANGNFPLFLQHNSHRDYLKFIFKGASEKREKLDPSEMHWLRSLEIIETKIDDFMFQYGSARDKDKKSKELLHYGVEIAKSLDSMNRDYINKTNMACPACPEHEHGVTWESWKKEISALNYFIQKTKRIYITDQSGVRVPIDLNIVKDQ